VLPLPYTWLAGFRSGSLALGLQRRVAVRPGLAPSRRPSVITRRRVDAGDLLGRLIAMVGAFRRPGWPEAMTPRRLPIYLAGIACMIAGGSCVVTALRCWAPASVCR
jgi:hypothetical protein